MDIQNYGYPQLGIMDIHNRSYMDMHISNYGYPQIELWISMTRIMDIHNPIMDIPNWFMDIHNSIMDRHKPIMGIKK